MLGTANFDAGPILRFMCGNLCYQIEHHLFPDLPHNRLPEIAERVRALFVTYDLPYTTGSFHRQYFLTVRTICKLALPNQWLSATSDNAPETASEHKFRNVAKRSASSALGHGVRRRGLATAILARGNRHQPTDHPTSPISGHRAGQGPAGSHHLSRTRNADELNASA
jgi:hypothetical protein